MSKDLSDKVQRRMDAQAGNDTEQRAHLGILQDVCKERLAQESPEEQAWIKECTQNQHVNLPSYLLAARDHCELTEDEFMVAVVMQRFGLSFFAKPN